ncbi:MAG TPA: FAD-dependent oxidoreductase [Candidatus Methylomirabilis sp.]|nr:FAD-dependent oxidoreductase [Candidatus Methylomirabilis sp.]
MTGEPEAGRAPRYDLVVLGAGPAGEKGAAQAAYFGKRVAVVDPSPRPGGTAVSTGGIPTKTLREGAIYLRGLGQSAFGVTGPSARDSWRVLMTRKLEVSEFMTKAVERNLVRHGIERICGRARFLAGRRVEVEKAGGVRVLLDGDVVLLASGSRPHHPPGIPMDDPDVHDSETILGIEEVPESMLVIGGGALGCEYASIFAALGVQVTIVGGGEHLLPALDVEMARVLAESFNAMGIRVIPNVKMSRVMRAGDALEGTLADGRTLRARKVLVAAGRRPRIEGLALGEVGVDLDESGWVQVDHHYRTTAPGVIAAGDVIGPLGLASMAMEQARVAVCHAFGFEYKKEIDRLHPSYMFSIPEAAWVGLTEEEARASGMAYEVGRSSFGTNAKARISGFPDGLVKLVFRVPDKTLLGVHILGELASELIHIGQFVMHEGSTIDRFIDATFAVPTRSEAFKYAAYDGLMRLARRAGSPTAG